MEHLLLPKTEDQAREFLRLAIIEAQKFGVQQPSSARDGLQKLAEFGRRCFDDAVSEGGDIEWDKAFEDAQEVGLLEPEHRSEPCAEIEQCRCSEAGIDFPTTCYRVPDRLMPLLQREQRTQCQPQEVE